MNKTHDLTGQQFGYLLVLGKSKRRMSSNVQWLCQCDCGRKLIVRGDNLLLGHTKQCSVCSPNGKTTSVFVKEGNET